MSDGMCGGGWAVRSALVAICTYKRPHLLPALFEALASQILRLPPEYKVRVAVIDNDPQGSDSGVEKLAITGLSQIESTYVHEPSTGVGHARNRAFSLVREGEWLVFFDDDQVPSETWLRALLDAPSRLTADMFAGPVRPKLPKEYPAWAEGAWAWRRKEYADGQNRPHAGFGNIMLSPAVLSHSACRVRPEFLNGPGEDTSVTLALTQHGFSIAHVLGASASELVTDNRLTVAWVLSRNRTAGRVWAQLSLESKMGRTRLVLSLARLVFQASRLRLRSILTKSPRDAVQASAYRATIVGYVGALERRYGNEISHLLPGR